MTILERVSAEGTRARRLVAVTAAAGAVGGAIAMLTVGALALGGGRWVVLPAWLPFVWWGIAIGCTAYVVRFMPRRMGLRASNEAVAREAESERGLRAGALVGLVQLAPVGGTFVALQEAVLGRIAGTGELAPRHARRLSFTSLAAVGAMVLVGLATWTSAGLGADGWRALVHPFAAATGTLLDPLSLEETPASMLRGDSLTAVIRAEGRRRVHLAWRVTGRAWRDTSLAVVDGHASMGMGSIDAPMMLVASDGRSVADSLDVAVYERPFAGDVAVRAVYPAYLGRASEVLAPDDALRLPEGTTIEVVARSAGLPSVMLASDRDTVAMTMGGGRARGHLVARASGTWRWISPVAGADLPPELVLDVVPDSAPLIDIISPTHDTLVTPGEDVRLVIAATDDHGLNAVNLKTWAERANGQRDGERTVGLNDVAGLRWMGELDVDLTNRNLKPGDALIVVAEARDGAPWGRVGTSRRLELRVPTADARRDAAMDAIDSAVARAAAAAAAQKGLEKRTADAARTTTKQDASKSTQQGNAKDGAASFEAQEKARELAADQRALGDKVQELSKEADRLSKELTKAGVMDSAISAELKEAQRLLKEAMTPELMKQLKDLDAQRQKMSPEEMQDALNKLQQPQQDSREALDKAHEMLKRAAMEGAMQSLADEAKELAQQQKQFADSAMKKPADAKDLADRAKDVQNDAQKLAERLQKEQSPEAKQAAKDAADKAKESADKMREAMQQAMEQMGGQSGQQAGQNGQQSGQQAGQQGKPGQQGQQGQGQQPGQQPGQGEKSSAQQAADAMQKASESMSQARQSQVDSWKQDITQALDRSIQETLQMARQQEQIGAQAKAGGSTAQVKAEQGALQQGVQQTTERLADQGQKSALISPSSQRAMDAARQSVEQATRDLNDATSSQAQRSMQDAADALRQASASMARDRERAGNSQSASGLPEMMQQMRQMAAQQGQLNGEAASLMQTMSQMAQGAAQSAAQEEAVKQLAQKQRQMAQKLEDASDVDPTRRAEALARDARQIAEQLARGAIDPSVIDRQQKLFTHMLDAGRTLEQDERDDSGKREAKSGQGITGNAPATGNSTGAAAAKFKEPTWDELRGLSAEERRLVIDYFRRLNAKKPQH